MELMQELIEATKISKRAAASVYHRDYERTKNKPYRKYDPQDHKKSTEEEEVSDDETITEARKVGEYKSSDGLKVAKVYVDGGEFIVKLFKDGKHYEPADYFTDDKADATGTAKHMVTEGAWDFVKGAARHVGNNVKQAVGNVAKAGQTQSALGDLNKSVAQLGKLLATYDQLKASQQQAQPVAQQQSPQVDQPQQQPSRQPAPTQPQGKPSDAVPSAFRTTTKPRIRNGEFVFSSYLQQHDGDFISEGAWDFLKGAVGHVGGSVKQAVGNAVQAGRDASSAADYKNTVQQAKQTIQNIAGLIGKLGEQGMNAFKQSLQNSGMNPLMQQRIYKLVLNASR